MTEGKALDMEGESKPIGPEDGSGAFDDVEVAADAKERIQIGPTDV